MSGKIRMADMTLGPDKTIKEAMRIIDHGGHGVSFIVDNGRLVGVLSNGDVQQAILKGIDISARAGEIMNPQPISLNRSDLKKSSLVKKTLARLEEKACQSSIIPLVASDDTLLSIEYVREYLGDRAQTSVLKNKKILIVGGAGYLGSVLTRKLLDKGYAVRVLDLMMFGEHSLSQLKRQKRFELIRGDMRNISVIASALKGIYAVINLAAIVGDPACRNLPEDAIETNYLANKALADACKYHQVNRFIYASTCSVYGIGNKDLTENSPLRPVSLYARSKIRSEEAILSLEDENFAPCILRMSTLFGYSPRMRFDLVVNTMTADAYFKSSINVHGGGKQWRPLLHVSDAADAYIRCLEAPIRTVKGEVFNVGSNSQNYQIRDIARLVGSVITSARIKIDSEDEDVRDYFVSFNKISKKLDYMPQHNMVTGIKGIVKTFRDGTIRDVKDRKYYNVWEN